MDNFLPQRDELSRRIQDESAKLYLLLEKLDIEKLKIADHCLYYLRASHLKRLFFSIQTSAHLLYRSIQKSGKNLKEIVLMDYGAGVGTLYMLAKMIGCRLVVYNDLLTEWKDTAYAISSAVNVHVDKYVVGDIEATVDELKNDGINCDIIISRNVIEHIYKLGSFYDAIFNYNPSALVYSSTTANYYNPASNIKHVLWHNKWEKVYQAQRKEIIRRLAPATTSEELIRLARDTRGLGGADLESYVVNPRLSSDSKKEVSVRTNTCDPFTGVWAEHLLKFSEYRELIGDGRYKISFAPGFWDTHYKKPWKNLLGWILNPLIKAAGTAGIVLSPFIYVIAEPQKASR